MARSKKQQTMAKWTREQKVKEKRALKDQKIERVVFNAITKQAVTEAMRTPRQIDGALVDAYMERRALDYLVGFTLSPVLWRKLPGARSAGRAEDAHAPQERAPGACAGLVDARGLAGRNGRRVARPEWTDAASLQDVVGSARARGAQSAIECGGRPALDHDQGD